MWKPRAANTLARLAIMCDGLMASVRLLWPLLVLLFSVRPLFVHYVLNAGSSSDHNLFAVCSLVARLCLPVHCLLTVRALVVDHVLFAVCSHVLAFWGLVRGRALGHLEARSLLAKRDDDVRAAMRKAEQQERELEQRERDLKEAKLQVWQLENQVEQHSRELEAARPEAPTSMSALQAEVDSLRAQLGHAHTDLGSVSAQLGDAVAELDEWRASQLMQVPSVWTSGAREQRDAQDVLVELPLYEWSEFLRGLMLRSSHTERKHWDCCLLRNVKILRVERVENFRLWQDYVHRARQMTADHKRNMLYDGEGDADEYPIDNISPLIGTLHPEYVDDFTTYLSGQDYTFDSVNEKWLLHGTHPSKARKIVQEGFDHRVAERGMYGSGTYFASEACKSHQYTCQRHPKGKCTCPGIRTVILSRVALGDPFYAMKTMSAWQRRPPPRQDGIFWVYLRVRQRVFP